MVYGRQRDEHDMPQVEAVFWQDKKLLPLEQSLSESRIDLLMADVTFIGDKRSGFEKVSSFCAVSGNHDIFLLTSGLLAHENTETFRAELQFILKHVDPTLASRSIVVIVDGDRGRIRALHQILPLAKVYMCLWHKTENMKS